MNKEILEITKKFHDTYEKLASEYTYETREDTKVFDINSNNGKLMYATVNGYKYKNGKDKTDNYTITFKIDADIEPFLKNIDKITFINSMETGAIETTTATDYVNELIRADLKKRFNIASDETDSNKWIDAYNKYAKKYGLKD